VRARAAFAVENGSLRISMPGSETRLVQPDGLEVAAVVPAKDGVSAFVLLEAPLGTGRIQNLIKVSNGGATLWHAELPPGDPTDSFVDLDPRVAKDLSASTSSGKRVRLDPESGRIRGVHFAK